MGQPSNLLPAVNPNEGLRVLYERKVRRLIDRMTADVQRELARAYKRNTPEIAQDASPAVELQRTLRRLARRWEKAFDGLAPELAKWFAKDASQRSDSALKTLLRKRGITVKFNASRVNNDVVQATIGENVTLIKSIPEQYMLGVEGAVMRSVAAGRDLSVLTKELAKNRGITTRRAANIARDQNNKATAVLTRVRQTELGIVEAVWIHSGAGKHPRPEHVAFSGKKYDVRKGAFLEGKWTWPGHEINCRCTSRSVIPGLLTGAS